MLFHLVVDDKKKINYKDKKDKREKKAFFVCIVNSLRKWPGTYNYRDTNIFACFER